MTIVCRFAQRPKMVWKFSITCVFPAAHGSRLFNAARLLDVSLPPLLSCSPVFFHPRALMVRTGTDFAPMEEG